MKLSMQMRIGAGGMFANYAKIVEDLLSQYIDGGEIEVVIDEGLSNSQLLKVLGQRYMLTGLGKTDSTYGLRFGVLF